jgi:septation ring formation regulator EzrA
MEEMRELVLGDQANSNFLMFNTSFSYDILGAFDHFKTKLYTKAKTPADKFDLLLAYTYNINEHDVWMHDNEGGMEGMVKNLASMWKKQLKNSNEILNIDAEYTRPGVVEFLVQFKEKVEDGDYPPFKFNFQQ